MAREEIDPSDCSPFALDVYELWKAGAVYVPQVADMYAEASNAVGHAEVNVPRAFVGRLEASYQPYETLRNYVTAVYGRIAENLYSVGEALEKSAFEFAEQDDTNAAGLSSIDQLESLIDGRSEEVSNQKEEIEDVRQELIDDGRYDDAQEVEETGDYLVPEPDKTDVNFDDDDTLPDARKGA